MPGFTVDLVMASGRMILLPHSERQATSGARSGRADNPRPARGEFATALRRRGIATALVSEIVNVLRARGVRCLEVTANPHAQGYYSAAGFIDCGVAETDFGAAPRKRLAIH